MFKEVSSKVSFPEVEEKILSFWKKYSIFNKSLYLRRDGEPFVFYEGPPTANGKPGSHHMLTRSYKDIICRYQTMKGRYVERKGGWDTHGLPVELEVEKELGITGKGKQAILNLKSSPEESISYFNDLCKKSVFRYVDDWVKITQRIGFWIDLNNPYVTLESSYIESVWAILKKLYEKDLLKQDYKVVPYCPRCQTPLSSHELALGYKDDVPDPSVFVKFELEEEPKTYFLVWTTTPWTLPGNVALAIGEDIEYVKVSLENGEKLILAEKRLEVLHEEFSVEEKLNAKDLDGRRYKPLFNFGVFDKEKAYFVTRASFANEDEGTGIVHTAVMYGEDDFQLGKKIGLPTKHTVDNQGRFTKDIKPFFGRFVKEADKDIIEDLLERGLLYKAGTIKHTYPFCWRCETPLLYYALDSWFVETTKIKDKLIENNKKINWVPDHVKQGRMGNWLETLVDWNITRKRFWATPLPIWKCVNGHVEVIGSLQEIRDKGVEAPGDLHRPYIDNVTFECGQCHERMVRIEDVLDVWFDSGSMPYAQWHYPFENKEKFDKSFPADYIVEGMDQTRGWFYTLMAVGTALGYESPAPYKNVISLGLVLDEKGQKMSKSKGNVVDPWSVLNGAGADAMRWYFFTSANAGNTYRFSLSLVEEAVRKFLLIYYNIYVFFVNYSNLSSEKFDEGKGTEDLKLSVLDKWVLSELNVLIETVERKLDNYDVTAASRLLQEFLTDLSTWYVRRIRDRVSPSNKDKEDKNAALQTLHKVLVTFTKLSASFIPFLTEEIYQNIVGTGSVHLADFPKSDQSLINKDLKEDMKLVRIIVEMTHADRKEKSIKVRQPLQKVKVQNAGFKNREHEDQLKDLIKAELNVKEVELLSGEGDLTIELDTNITPELKAEGEARELVRLIQEKRKEAQTRLNESIIIFLPSWPKEFEDYIKRETLSIEIKKGDEIKVQRVDEK